MVRFNCYACHERDKVGGVTDDMKAHFTATFKEWGDEVHLTTKEFRKLAAPFQGALLGGRLPTRKIT